MNDIFKSFHVPQLLITSVAVTSKQNIFNLHHLMLNLRDAAVQYYLRSRVTMLFKKVVLWSTEGFINLYDEVHE